MSLRVHTGISFKLLIIPPCNLQKPPLFTHSRSQSARAVTSFSAQDLSTRPPHTRSLSEGGGGRHRRYSAKCPSRGPSSFLFTRPGTGQHWGRLCRALPLSPLPRRIRLLPWAYLGHRNMFPGQSRQQLTRELRAAGGKPALTAERAESRPGGSDGAMRTPGGPRGLARLLPQGSLSCPVFPSFPPQRAGDQRSSLT